MGDEDVDSVRDASVQWLNDVLVSLGCNSVGDLSPFKCKAPKKEVLASWIYESLHHISEQNELIKKLRDGTGTLQKKLIGSQQKVIDLQGELLGSKTEQIAAFQTTVKTSVEDGMKAVQSGLQRSWSEAVAKSSSQAIPTETKLKEAVKSAVAEEDNAKNVMIFGKKEEENEDIAATVAEILQDTKQKPRVVECIRVGTPRVGKPRPIKVKLFSADAASSILHSAKNLKSSDTNKHTYIAPDRTQEERTAHRKLVEKMKEMIRDDTDSYHYILNGAIRSVKKSVEHTK